MSNQNQVVGFELSVSGRDDGTIEAAYFRFKKGKVAETGRDRRGHIDRRL